MSDQQTSIQFKGNAKEYFGIWIVNLMLSIVTLGIYSAWAKVRDKKYFYHNTLIDGAAFGYHAKPMAILKGRLIAFGLFVAYQLASSFSPALGILLAITFSLAIPWIFVRGLKFNAINSSHRGLRFDFNGRYAEAVKMLLLYPMLYVVSFGLAYPFVAQRVKQFFVNQHRFGLSNFKMGASVKDYYKIYLKLFAGAIALSVFVSVVGASIKLPFFDHDQPKTTTNSAVSRMPSQHSVTTHQPSGFIKVNNAKPDLSHLSPEERAEIEDFMNKQAPKDDPKKDAISMLKDMAGSGILAMLLPVLLYGLFILSVLAYIKVRIGNLVWNHTTLDHIRFISTQRVRDVWWIYFSNMLALIVTLGLATPWAKVRLARYRINHLAIAGETDWDQFVGEKKESTRALGEEMADMFDIDIAF